MTDDQADLVFANLAQLLTPASQRDPKAWAKLQAVADRLRQQLAGGSASDDQIESTITKMADACQVARRAPKSAGPASTSTSTTPAPSTTSPA